MKVKRTLYSTLFIITLLLLNTSLASATTVAELEKQIAPDAVPVFEQIRKCYKAGDDSKVFQLADMLIEKYQDNKATLIRAYLSKISSYIALHNYESAREACEAAYNLDPTYPEPEYYTGLILQKEKKFNEAIPHLNICIDAEKDNASCNAYWIRGLCFEGLGDYSSALRDYQKAISKKSDRYNFYFSEGYAYYMLKNYNAAAISFSKTIIYKPNHKRAYIFRAKCYRALGSEEQAIQDEKRARSL